MQGPLQNSRTAEHRVPRELVLLQGKPNWKPENLHKKTNTQHIPISNHL